MGLITIDLFGRKAAKQKAYEKRLHDTIREQDARIRKLKKLLREREIDVAAWRAVNANDEHAAFKWNAERLAAMEPQGEWKAW